MEYPVKHTYFSLNKASKETGKSTSVISRDLADGKISYIEKTKKGYKIDPAELFRVYPRKQENGIRTSKRTGKKGIENSLLEREIELLREQLNSEKDNVSDLRRRLDDTEKKRNEAEQAKDKAIEKYTAILTDQREKPSSPDPEKPILGFPDRLKIFWYGTVPKNENKPLKKQFSGK